MSATTISTPESRTRWHRFSLLSPQSSALLLVLLLAFALRAFRLDDQSLWYDEGVSAYMTTRGLEEIAQAASADIHPPLYYWLLHAWALVFGSGEVALRGLSVLLGVLTGWAVWRLGTELLDRTVGLLAAALLAVSPLAIQYSQEVRMYALAAFLSVSSTWAYTRLFECDRDERSQPEGTPGGRTLPIGMTAVYGLLAAALIYTHYYGILVLAAHQIHFGLMLVATRRWSWCWRWAAASAITIALYLPWLSHALRQTGHYPGLGTPHPWWTLVLDAANVLSLGVPTTRFAFRLGLGLFLIFALAGILAGSTRRRPAAAQGGWPGWSGTALLTLWLLVPIAGIVMLSQSRPLYEPRFLMLVLPAWLLLVASGITWLAESMVRTVRSGPFSPVLAGYLIGFVIAVVLGSLVIPTARSLVSYYFDPAYARDDYRGLARRIADLERPGDAIVLTAPGQAEVFGYYFHGASDRFPLPAQRPIDVSDTRMRLETIAGGHRRIWLVRWSPGEADPDDLITHWLESRGRRVAAELFGRVELHLFDLIAAADAGPFDVASHGDLRQRRT